jgi:hypothetical protein
MPLALILTVALASCHGGACGARAVYAAPTTVASVPLAHVNQWGQVGQIRQVMAPARPPRRFFGLFRRRR